MSDRSGTIGLLSSANYLRINGILGAGRSGFTLCDPIYTVKPVLSGHSKIDKTKVLKTNGSLMKVESIAECSLGPTLSDNRS